jgi:hypothetical protein
MELNAHPSWKSESKCNFSLVHNNVDTDMKPTRGASGFCFCVQIFVDYHHIMTQADAFSEGLVTNIIIPGA